MQDARQKRFLFETIVGRFVVESQEARKATLEDNAPIATSPEEIRACLDKISQVMDFKLLREANLELSKKQIKDSFSQDQLIILATSAVEELDHTINSLLGRLAEWLDTTIPEVVSDTKGSERLAEIAQVLELKKTDDKHPEAHMDVREETEMGAALREKDLVAVRGFADSILNLASERKKLEEYLDMIMEEICPNLKSLAGVSLGGKLIQLAGSLKRLCEMPSSTLQILGAEKALFRHLTTGAKPPKYGILSQHPYLLKAKKKHHGKIARLLADKIMIAVRVDYFKGEFMGVKLKEDLDQKLSRLVAEDRP